MSLKRLALMGLMVGGLMVMNAVASAEGVSFRDVPSDYPYKSYIEDLAKQKLIEGTSEGIFSPETSLTREQFAKLTVTAFQLPASDAPPPFEDCPSTSWSSPFIASAYRAGIIQGVDDSHFAPERVVRKQEAIVMLERLLGPGATQQPGGDWASEAVKHARSAVIPDSRKEMLNDLESPVSRGEAAAFISFYRQSWGLGASKDKPIPVSASGQAASHGAEAWFQVELASQSYVQLKLDDGTIQSIEGPGGNPVPVRAPHLAGVTTKEGGRYLIHASDLKAGASLQVNDGTSQEHALDLVLDAAGIQTTIANGQTVYVRSELQKYQAVELAAHDDRNLTYRLTASDSNGTTIKQKSGPSLQFIPEYDGVHYLSIFSENNTQSVSISLYQIGTVESKSFKLQTGEYKMIFPESGILHVNVQATRASPFQILTQGAQSYQITEPNKDMSIPYNSVKHSPATKPNLSYGSLTGDPVSVNCTCSLQISAQPGALVSFRVLDGASLNHAYYVNWRSGEWKTDYRGDTTTGVFYKMELKQHATYSFIVDSKAMENPDSYMKMTGASSNQKGETFTVKEPQNQKLIIYDPDGLQVFTGDPMKGTLFFTASKAGSYTVVMQSDGVNYTSQISATGSN